MKIKVAIVDDDTEHLELLTKYMKGYGIEVLGLKDGYEVLSTIKKNQPDIIILDILLPGKDGLEVLKEIRQNSSFHIPVIMLTAKGEEADRIVGLEMGADDYVSKPFNPRELLARIKAVMRRSTPYKETEAREYAEGNIRVGELTLNGQRLLLSSGEKNETLSFMEYKILKLLMGSPGRVFSREEILDAVYGFQEAIAYDRTIDVCINRLRNKIEYISSHRDRIKTARGVGYFFMEDK